MQLMEQENNKKKPRLWYCAPCDYFLMLNKHTGEKIVIWNYRTVLERAVWWPVPGRPSTNTTVIYSILQCCILPAYKRSKFSDDVDLVKDCRANVFWNGFGRMEKGGEG